MKLPRWLRVSFSATRIVVIVLAVSGWLLVRSLSPLSRCDERRFTTTLWRDSVASFGPKAVRGCVVDDLIRSTQLRGRSRTEIVALLGEPPRTDYFRDYDLVYWLGPERGLVSIDSEWLVLRLDSNGRVSEYRLVTD